MIITFIDRLFLIYMIMLFIRILGSWVPELQQNRLMQFVAFYTDSYLNLFRRIIPPIGLIDISPIVAFFALSLIEGLCKFLVAWAMR